MPDRGPEVKRGGGYTLIWRWNVEVVKSRINIAVVGGRVVCQDKGAE